MVFKQPKHDANSDKARLLDHEDPDDTDGYGTFLSSVPKNQERPVSPPLPRNVAVKVSVSFGHYFVNFLNYLGQVKSIRTKYTKDLDSEYLRRGSSGCPGGHSNTNAVHMPDQRNATKGLFLKAKCDSRKLRLGVKMCLFSRKRVLCARVMM